MGNEKAVQRVPIEEEADVPMARRSVRDIGISAGLLAPDVEALATAVTELARNILVHARRGEVVIEKSRRGDRPGVIVVARDEGPGIAEVNRALEDGFTTAGGLGLGLPSTRRLVDDFAIESRLGAGTIVSIGKWVK